MTIPETENIWKKRPLIIAGPCSAETEEQVLQTAIQIANTKSADVFRAGIWKPRTKPGMFEGIGAKGLPWLQKVKATTGLFTAVEVANGKQVQDALNFGIDILWVGARTTVNPFSVQEIADALRGVQIPIFIKNPINPDVELWSGAVERMVRAGLQHIGLIHRGFSSYGNTEYRNAPMWHLAVDMKLRNPDLPMVVDPSHICGNRSGIKQVAQTAIDMNFDGLMVETHHNPDKAWSDAKQQVTPIQFLEILQQIIWRKEDVDNEVFHATLEKFRSQINMLDNELLQILAQRMKIVDQIGAYKKEHDITILQKARWADIVGKMLEQSAHVNLSKEFITSYLEVIHNESINRQRKILES